MDAKAPAAAITFGRGLGACDHLEAMAIARRLMHCIGSAAARAPLMPLNTTI